MKILKIDKETGKLSLSLKQAMADPWTGVENRYAVGTEVTGRITRVPPEGFGAFVEIEEGIEGLLPVSEMSWQRIRHPSEVVKEGDTQRLVVIAMDPSLRKMTFSLKQAGPDPWKQVKDKYALDMVVSGAVTRVVDFGAFVEMEPGLEGLVHISELDAKRVRASSDVVKPGQEVKVRILEIDPEAQTNFPVDPTRQRSAAARGGRGFRITGIARQCAGRGLEEGEKTSAAQGRVGLELVIPDAHASRNDRGDAARIAWARL